ncbi:putative Protein phosphatase 1 regulatory subunit 3B [Hypsibius exemplaris]|uniref:CBM21 domain-containing protein n=1 Tax=Hypsibius exemplaris TaxID=2072580 RepID=A0A1W0XBZ9_HYPEX|nr:putative Protein phosphatase 1 regulatory subunit 3B [Hypsibius exemplaris]
MPSPAGYDYVFTGSSLQQAHSTAAQLASSQFSHYFAASSIKGLAGADGRGNGGGSPFSLRGSHHGPAIIHKSVSAPGSLLLTHSILSNRGGANRPSFERRDSLEDGPLSPDPYDSPPPVAPHPWGSRHRAAHRSSRKVPILKQQQHFLECSSAEKKRVSFADDMGLDLERTRFFTEELDCSWGTEPEPGRFGGPKSAEDAMDDEDLVVEISEWQVNFSQPAADYLGFREKLETRFVALENVIIKQKTNSFMGTIKVQNMSFKKDVFVRCTFNGWDTFSDYPAKFCGKASDAVDKYDTFSFEIVIPTNSRTSSSSDSDKQSVEFCIGFRSDGQEYWDSNTGRNYQLITSQQKQRRATEKQTDAYAIHSLAGSWSQFASWNHLDSTRPYY